jgi:hypothetical protein
MAPAGHVLSTRGVTMSGNETCFCLVVIPCSCDARALRVRTGWHGADAWNQPQPSAPPQGIEGFRLIVLNGTGWTPTS